MIEYEALHLSSVRLEFRDIWNHFQVCNTVCCWSVWKCNIVFNLNSSLISQSIWIILISSLFFNSQNIHRSMKNVLYQQCKKWIIPQLIEEVDFNEINIVNFCWKETEVFHSKHHYIYNDMFKHEWRCYKLPHDFPPRSFDFHMRVPIKLL